MTTSFPSIPSAQANADAGTTVEAPKPRILLVDDDANIRRVLETRLTMFGYDVATASDGEEALALFQTVQPDLVVLDVMMPKMDGYGVIQALRQHSEVPIVLLSACAEVKDRILGLEIGADDYITKPFSPKELEARIRCVLRRSGSANAQTAGGLAPQEIKIGQLMILPHKRQVFKGGERVRLTGMEFDLLEMLMAHSGQPLTRQDMLSKIWGYTPERHSDTRVVDVHISRLRNKIEDDPENPELVITARGTGYLFQRLPVGVGS
jgi:OmpR family response regulator RpaB